MTRPRYQGVNQVSISGSRSLKFPTQDALIEAIKREMKEGTAESLNPWRPVGGVFGLVFSSLPPGVKRRELADTIQEQLNGIEGVSIDRVVVEDSIVAVHVKNRVFQTQRELLDTLVSEAATIVPVNSRMPYPALHVKYSELPADLNLSEIEQELASLLSEVHHMTLVGIGTENGVITVNVKQ